jgi:subtilisin family serine protease
MTRVGFLAFLSATTLSCWAAVGTPIGNDPAYAQSAQKAARFPVIVVFDQHAPFHRFEGGKPSDERALKNPEAFKYIASEVAGAVQSLELAHGFLADHVYSAALRGFAARLSAEQIQALEQHPLVAYVEPDGVMTANAQVLPWGIDRVDADISSTLAGNGSGAINNVNVYIIDTGIDQTHPDLNVVNHVNFTPPPLLGLIGGGGGNKDCNGHGTHVAGTVAARDNASDVVGAAPGARLTGVKVLDCSGSGPTSQVIKGVDWVTANAQRPAVANMSLGGGVSTALDDAVRRSAASGVVYALAAGNSGADACTSSPARAGAGTNGIITMAATDENNQEASFSNFGQCVDVWAPGVNILSTRLGGGTTTLSGTSMASPHGAGVAALLLSTQGTLTTSLVESELKADAVGTGTNSKDGRAIQLINAAGY